MTRFAPGIRPHRPKFLRIAPWIALSLFLNAGAIAALLLLGSASHGPEFITCTISAQSAYEIHDRLCEEVKPDIQEPIIKDAKVPDHDGVPFEESLGKADFLSDAPFTGPVTNSAIGLGGGAGGVFGGRDRALEEFQREGYDAIVEEGFKDPRKTPLSTFSIDVDTASYANVRRMLRNLRQPPKGAVRIEEMLNYFSYDYAEPAPGQPFSVTTEVAECPWNPSRRIVHIGIQGRVVPEEEIPPRNLVFLLDVSGSMQAPDKLELVVRSMRLLVSQLDEHDRVAIVVYAGASGLVLPPTAGDRHREINRALDSLSAGGSTNGAAGIRLAYGLARRHFIEGGVNRVILATDGDFNVGTTSRSDLTDLIEQKRESGIFLTVLGVGTGNLKDSQMEMLADKGNGNYAYLDSDREAEKVLVRELGGTLITIAKDVKIQVEFNPDRVGAYRLIGYENRKLAARDFNDDKKDAGEIGAGHSVTALYEILPVGECPENGEVDALKYQVPTAPSRESTANEILTLKLRYKRPDGDRSVLRTFPLADPGNVNLAATSRDFQFAAAVATFGLALRGSEHRGEANFDLAAELAHPALGEDRDGLREEFIELCEQAKLLGELR